MASLLARCGRARVALVALAAGLVGPVAACDSAGSGQSGSAGPTQGSYERVITMVLPSVVQIEAGKATGSGVVFDASGDVVTNAHVVAGVKGGYQVIASQTAKPLPARLIGSFAPDDLAVIRVTSGAASLRPVRWADSDRAAIGQLVLAMGSP